MAASLLGNNQVYVQMIVIHGCFPTPPCFVVVFLFCSVFCFYFGFTLLPISVHSPVLVNHLPNSCTFLCFLPTHQTLFVCLLPPICLLKLSLSLHSTQLYLWILDANWTLLVHARSAHALRINERPRFFTAPISFGAGTTM